MAPFARKIADLTNGSAGQVNWDLVDNQDSVCDVLQFNGTSTSDVGHVIYSAFGAVNSQMATSASSKPPFFYDGEWQDPDTKMYDDGLRWYDAVDQLFASQDPLGFGGGQTNTEEFVGNSPVNATDPTGMMSDEEQIQQE